MAGRGLSSGMMMIPFFGKKRNKSRTEEMTENLETEILVANSHRKGRFGEAVYKWYSRTRLARFLGRERPRKSNVMRIAGLTLFAMSFLMLFAVWTAFAHNEDVYPYLIPSLGGFAVSIAILLIYGSSNVYRPVQGVLAIVTVWIITAVFGCIPYLLCDWYLMDAIFETISGFATVGASVIADSNTYYMIPSGLLSWRISTQWIGGIMIILIFMVILPMFTRGAHGLSRSELDAAESGRLYQRVDKIATRFILVYIILTLVAAFALFMLSYINNDYQYDTMQRFEDSCYLAMSTVSIGGFLNRADVLTGANIFVKIFLIILIAVSITNFYLHFRAIARKSIGVYFEDSEFKAMIIWFGVVTVVTLLLVRQWDKFVDILFTIVSYSSTLGIVTLDPATINAWPTMALFLLYLGMLVGGCAGSPAGGIKISRVLIVIKSTFIEIYRFFNSSIVYSPKLNNKGVSEERVRNAYVIFSLFVIAIVISTFVYATAFENGTDIQKGFFTAISIVSLTGTSELNFAATSVGIQIYTCVLMIFARMEFIALLTIFLPKFWSEVFKKNVDGFINTQNLSFMDKLQFKRDEKAEK